MLYTQTLDMTLALTLEYRLVFSTDSFICFGLLDADIQSSSFWFLEFYILNGSSNIEFVSNKSNAIDCDVDILWIRRCQSMDMDMKTNGTCTYCMIGG